MDYNVIDKTEVIKRISNYILNAYSIPNLPSTNSSILANKLPNNYICNLDNLIAEVVNTHSFNNQKINLFEIKI